MSFPMKPTPNARNVQRAVDTFNAGHPVGTAVLVDFDGTERPGTTRSPAFILAGTPAVKVRFIGIQGRFEISRVRKAA